MSVQSSSTAQIAIDSYYQYTVDAIRQGGMGTVLLLSRAQGPALDPLANTIYGNPGIQERFRYPYRERIAAKTVTRPDQMNAFERECRIWLELDHPGIVPLLKISQSNGSTFALMPRYVGSLRDRLNMQRCPVHGSPLLALVDVVNALDSVYRQHSVVHQDIKPENILMDQSERKLVLRIADWGIANLQARRIQNVGGLASELSISTMGGFGTLPYMAPERFCSYISDIRADIFSLGIILCEILTGSLPYRPNHSPARQILSGEYFHIADQRLRYMGSRRKRVLAMIHPDANRRLDDYSRVLKILTRMT